MALQSSGQISFANIINEFGDSGGGLGAYRPVSYTHLTLPTTDRV